MGSSSMWFQANIPQDFKEEINRRISIVSLRGGIV